MPKSDIAMSGDEIAAMEAEELAPAETTTPEKPVADTPERKGGKSDDLPEFVAEPEEDEGKSKADPKAKPDGKAKKPPGERTTVPHEALHAEREEHKKTRAALQEQQIRQARLEERIAAINDAMARQAQQKPAVAEEAEKIPAVNEDPLAAIAWTQQQLLAERAARTKAENARAEAEQQHGAQTAEQQAASREWGTAFRDVSGYWEQKAAENPQLTEAYNALRQSTASELVAHGWRGQQEIVQELNRIEAAHILNCWRSGEPIDKLVIDLATARGWKPKAAEAEVEDEPEVPNGKANADTLKRLARAQGASDTLSGMGGGSEGNKISLETLDRMSDKEMQALVKQLERTGEGGMDRALAKMMGVPAGRA